MPKNIEKFLKDIQNQLGEKGIIVDAKLCEKYNVDWTGKYQSSSIAVIRPKSTQEMSFIVKQCNLYNISIVPQGGNTGVTGGSIPGQDGDWIVLSTERMASQIEIDVNARTVMVEAGVILEVLQKKCADQGLLFPLNFGAKGSCTLGGNLATNAGGSNVLRYGNTRELCLGVEAVLADGTILDALNALRKDNSGYDLKDLLIGSEGTLGIITRAVFKLFPLPKQTATAFFATENIETALLILNRLQDATDGAVQAFEYLPSNVIDVIVKHNSSLRCPIESQFDTGILVEISTSKAATDETNNIQTLLENELGKLFEQELVSDAAIALNEQHRLDFWEVREAVLESITANGPALHLDISLPLDKIGNFLTAVDGEAKKLGLSHLTIGHIGDGNLHFAITPQEADDWDVSTANQVADFAYGLVTKFKGSISAEHGIGVSKLDILEKWKSESYLGTMSLIKNAIDPNAILNPGRMFRM